jgi:hypothetical protein
MTRPRSKSLGPRVSLASAALISAVLAACSDSPAPQQRISPPAATTKPPSVEPAPHQAPETCYSPFEPAPGVPACLTCDAECRDLHRTDGGAQLPPPPREAPLAAGEIQHPQLADDGPRVIYAFSKIFWGDTVWDGASEPEAWRSLGLDLDGYEPTGPAFGVCHCQLVCGTKKSSIVGGVHGIDNAFGKGVLPILLGFVDAPSAEDAARIQRGERTLLLTLPELAAGNETHLHGELGWGESGILRDDGLREWQAVNPSATASLDGGYVNGDRWVSGRPTTIHLHMPFPGGSWDLPVHGARLTARIAPEGLMDGVISGIVSSKELAEVARQIAGSISSSLCSGSTFQGIREQLERASDITLDGKQDPARPCDGISFGIGFEAVRAAVAPGPAGVIELTHDCDGP